MTYKQPQRALYPLDEAIDPWLKILLDAYYQTDLGVHEGVARVTGKGNQLACAPGEDAFHTRRQNVLTPIRSYKDMALEITVPFYGKVTQSEQKKLVQSGRLDQLARAMRDCQ